MSINDKVRIEFKSQGGPWFLGIKFAKIVQVGSTHALIVQQDENKHWRDANTGEWLPYHSNFCRMHLIK